MHMQKKRLPVFLYNNQRRMSWIVGAKGLDVIRKIFTEL